jgi:hypothetical protein
MNAKGDSGSSSSGSSDSSRERLKSPVEQLDWEQSIRENASCE